jgi:hypothetical protein
MPIHSEGIEQGVANSPAGQSAGRLWVRKTARFARLGRAVHSRMSKCAGKITP